MSISKIKTKSLALSSVTSDIIVNNTVQFIDLAAEVASGILDTRTTVQTNSGNWDSVYTTVLTQSAYWVGGTGGPGADTEVRGLTANWESTYTTVQSNSSYWSNIIDLAFKTAYSTYYHELKYDTVSSNLTAIQIYQNNNKTTQLFEKLLTYTSNSLLTGISITDKISNKTLTKTLSYDSLDNLIATTRIYN